MLNRYKRFLADVEVPGIGVVTAHCANTGSMKTCWKPQALAQISRSDNPRRKLQWTLERVDMGGGWIGVNTMLVNAVVAEGVGDGAIGELSGYATMRREPACRLPGFPRSRLDLHLSGGVRPDAWVEVKNVTLLRDEWIQFPDAVTERGRKHLEMLSVLAQSGDRAVCVFALNRPEGKGFKPAADIDPDYAESLASAVANGVEVLTVRLQHGRNSIRVAESAKYL